MRRFVLHMLVIVAPLTAIGAPQHRTAVRQLPAAVQLTEEALIASAIRKVVPAYPRLARAARVSGSVPVKVIADEDGNTISVLALSGHPLLKDWAIAAARGWKFKPSVLDGRPVKLTGIVTFNFNWRCDVGYVGASPTGTEIECDGETVERWFHSVDGATKFAQREFMPPLGSGSFPAPREYWLIGRVVDDRTGLPVPRAAVDLERDRVIPASCITDERGEFSFHDVPATRIQLKGSGTTHIEVFLFRWPGTGFSASRYTSRSNRITVSDANGNGIPGASNITLRVVSKPSGS